MPLPPQNFARLLCSIPFWLGFMRQSNEVYSLSDTCWERSYYGNPGLTWKRMLTVLFVKALQAPQGTCIETLHTCWCIFWWCSWHSSCRTQEEVGRAARPAHKLAPQGVAWFRARGCRMMSSKSKEMTTKNHTRIDPKQVGNKTKKLRILELWKILCYLPHGQCQDRCAQACVKACFILRVKRKPPQVNLFREQLICFNSMPVGHCLLRAEKTWRLYPCVDSSESNFQISSGALRGLSPT